MRHSVKSSASGWKTSLEAAQASTRPLVASHSTCEALNSHVGSKPDDVIKAIVDSGGYIGICCIPRFLGGNVQRVIEASI
ncbi:MAG: membrane dipeptidase [Planctomycetales bacterium]|nr:membrane dipeptidase [Planctomycetales bacterium]MCA9180958.1 membrane dipeptidase [Planctomycetales bacterium]